MSNDHYVAQTSLKHFADPAGRLRAYRKSGKPSFPCRPKDICREEDGDIIPNFLVNPKSLGAYRATFEKVWDQAVAALQARSPDMSVMMDIAG
jgi:hypothetical protein